MHVKHTATKHHEPAAHADNVAVLTPRPAIIPRSDHPISRADISENALKVLYRLDKAGYQACLVGGSVRDLLLGRSPKDFDIATNARPEQVRELFRNCRLIGRRFRLAHVRFGHDIIEVATFRAAAFDEEEHDRVIRDGRIVRDNVYGEIEDDVWRRDFTVNALYYNIKDYTVIDYVGGVADIRAKRLRLIGDPASRLLEDPVRMLRAVRFAVKLGFSIDPGTSQPFGELAGKLGEIAPARLFDEMLKMFHGGHALAAYLALREHGLFGHLFPLTQVLFDRGTTPAADAVIRKALANTDQRIAELRPVTPGFLFAALLWHPMQRRAAELEAEGLAPLEALRIAADTIISQQIARIAIPRRFTQITRDIWSMQARLARRTPKTITRLMEHENLRAGYDFLLLRQEAGEDVAETVQWWTRFLGTDPDSRAELVATLAKEGRRRPARRRRRRRNKT
jgi:poly(A) polymerase